MKQLDNYAITNIQYYSYLALVLYMVKTLIKVLIMIMQVLVIRTFLAHHRWLGLVL